MTPQRLGVSGRWVGFQRLNGDGTAAPAAPAMDLTGVLDALELPVVVLRRDLRLAGFNAAAAGVLGLAPTDIGRTTRDISIFAAWSRLEYECRDVFAAGVESRVDLRNGDRWFDARVVPYSGGDGEVTGVVLTFSDVTAFRASIDQAIYERECTKAIVNTVSDPIVVLTADQRIQSGNRAFHSMFGVSRDEAQGAALHRLAEGAFEDAALREQFAEVLAGGCAFQPCEVDGVATPNGQRVLVLDAHPLPLPGRSERNVLLTFHDITARKQAEAVKDLRSEEDLRRSEAFLAEGQRLSSTGSFSWKVATDEIAWSEQLYRIYDFDVGVPVTLELMRTRIHPEDVAVLEKMVRAARDGSEDLEFQCRLVMPDHSIKYLHTVAHATRDQDGRLEYIAAVQDITARRLSEEALARARSELARVTRVTSLGVLTASIAHEVNQPLSGIVTNAGTCLRMLDADPPNLSGARETVVRTLRDGNRAADVIKRLRALFSNAGFARERLDLNELTREVIALSLDDLERSRVAVQLELADDLPTMTGDRVQLQQVILNLIRNALDAMVGVHGRPRRLLITTEREDDDNVRVSVRDSGVGVDPESMNKLLDAFYTTKRDGMGIGLSVSRSIVERHAGRLWAEPNDGPGATFSFSLPSRPEAAAERGIATRHE